MAKHDFSPEAFETAVHEITSGGKYYFLEEQLYYFFCRRHRSGMRELASMLTRGRPCALERNEFQAAFREFIAWRGPVSRLIVSGRSSEHDVFAGAEAFEFDFLLVTQTADIARLLLANNFHLDNGVAVISMSGYPAGFHESWLARVRVDREIPVICIHDISPAGMRMRDDIQSGWFRGDGSNRILLDAGLRPRNFLRRPSRFFTWKDSERDHAGDGPYARQMFPRESYWLADGHCAHLTNLDPRDLMFRLRRYILKRRRERDKFQKRLRRGGTHGQSS